MSNTIREILQKQAAAMRENEVNKKVAKALREEADAFEQKAAQPVRTYRKELFQAKRDRGIERMGAFWEGKKRDKDRLLKEDGWVLVHNNPTTGVEKWGNKKDPGHEVFAGPNRFWSHQGGKLKQSETELSALGEYLKRNKK